MFSMGRVLLRKSSVSLELHVRLGLHRCIRIIAKNDNVNSIHYLLHNTYFILKLGIFLRFLVRIEFVANFMRNYRLFHRVTALGFCGFLCTTQKRILIYNVAFYINHLK